MSQENVEVVRRSFEAFNARDVDQLAGLFDPDCQWLPFRAQLEGTGIYRGHEGVRRFVRDVDEDWAAFGTAWTSTCSRASPTSCARAG